MKQFFTLTTLLFVGFSAHPMEKANSGNSSQEAPHDTLAACISLLEETKNNGEKPSETRRKISKLLRAARPAELQEMYKSSLITDPKIVSEIASLMLTNADEPDWPQPFGGTSSKTISMRDRTQYFFPPSNTRSSTTRKDKD